MDRHTLVIVAVTAATTTIVIGVLNWMFAIFNAIIPITATSERVRKIFSTTTSKWILWDIIWAAFDVWCLIKFVKSSDPITRGTILEGMLVMIATVGMLSLLIFHSAQLVTDRFIAKSKRAIPPAEPAS